MCYTQFTILHNGSPWFLMRTFIKCRAFFFPPIFFPCYWITNSVTSFAYTMLKVHFLFFCMPYFVLSSALLLLTLLPLFQTSQENQVAGHDITVTIFASFCRPSLLQDERLYFDGCFKAQNIWIVVSTFNSSIPQQNSIQHPFQHIPS